MGDLSITLHHDGVFVPNPCKYVNGRIKVLNETRFEEMQVGELFEIINKLTLSNAKHIYYCLPGTTLTLGIREIKTYSDMVEFMRLGYENDNRMELYTEHHGYDVLQYNHNDNLASDNEQSDVDPDYEGESDPENVDFHTEGEQGVEFEKLSVDDPFLNKLVGNGNFIGTRSDPIPPLVGNYHVEADDPEDEIIDGMHKADKGIKYPAYDPEQPWNENKPVLGMRYESPQQLKHALANYGVANGFKLWYYRNDADCLLVFCGRDLSIGRCASKKKLSNKYNLSPQGKGKGETQGNGKGEHQQKAKEKGKGKMDEQSQENVKWTKARVLSDKGHACPFRLWASWMQKERSFQIKTLYSDHKCARDYNLGSLVTFRWIAQHYANEIIQNPSIPTRFMINDIREKFLINVSSEYRQAVLESNPGSTCHIDQEVLEDDGKIHFTRIYVCYKGLKDGWLAGCRRVIGLDGCFLTHYCKGELLTVVGRDANNQMFPIAWAVVKVENKNTWCWFLSLLCNNLDLQSNLGITIISDGYKGLIEATGVLYKRLFWAAVSSTVEQRFLNHMDEIRRLDLEAYAYLMGREPVSWCRAFFQPVVKCASFENGISESFNSRLVTARGKPIITMLEDIRVYVMQRNWAISKQASDLDDNIRPSIRKKLNILKKQQKSCQLWDIFGIPCVHAVASYMHLHMDPDLGVNSWNSQSKWFYAYQFSIKPVSGSKMWKSTSNTPPLPPLLPKMPGRPRKKRIKHPIENDHEQKRWWYTSKRGGGLGVGRVVGSVSRGDGSVGRGGGSVGRGGGSVGRGNSKRGGGRGGGSVGKGGGSVGRGNSKRGGGSVGRGGVKRGGSNSMDTEWEGDGFEEPDPDLRLATMSDLVAADEAHDEHFNNMPSLTNRLATRAAHLMNIDKSQIRICDLASMNGLVAADEAHDEHFNNMPSLTNDVSLDVSHTVEGNNDALLNNGAVSLNVALPINVLVTKKW
ncbi:hypothetical protein Tco_0104900 [Tanacetum coccineum]